MSSDIHDPKSADGSSEILSRSPSQGGAGDADTTQTIAGLPPTLIPLEGDWQNEKTVISNRPVVPGMEPGPIRNSAALGERLVGSCLDHYELVEFVGGGGMGAVFRALDTRLGRTVAVKVLSRDHNDEETIRRFRNEAQSAARLDHPNIARVHYVGEALGFNYIVFEFIEGTNARDWIYKNGPMSVADCMRLTYRIAEALDHASQRDVVHRDIKPSNILITADGQVKLVDMGLARLHQMEASTEDLTESGVTLGTFDYISPEQARDPRLADVRSDIYSLGCTIFFLLTGQPPFPDGTALQKLLKHNGDEPPSLREFRDDLSERTVRMVQRMLAKRPAQRFQSAGELAGEILRVADEIGIPITSQYASRTIAENNKWQPWLAGIAIAAPVLMMFLLVFGMDRLLPHTVSAAPPFQPKLQPAVTPVHSSGNEEPFPATDPSGNSTTTPLPSKPDSAAASNDSDSSNSPDNTTTKPPASTLPNSASSQETNVAPTASTSDPNSKRPVKPTPKPPGTDPTTVGESGTNGTTAVRPRIWSKVIVRKTAQPADGIVDQLSAAVKLAAERGLSEIELQFDGPVYERPFVMPSRDVVIRAGNGFHPVVVFRPNLGSIQDDQRMIRQEGSGVADIHFQGIEFRLELPSQSSSLGWSLFAVGQVRPLALEDCLVTVQNRGPAGSTLHYPVAVFEILPPRAAEMMMEGKSMMLSSSISLTRTIVRGQTMLVSMQEDIPVDLNWQDGMLAISESALSSQGSTIKTKGFGRIDFRWERVSAYCGNGLYQLLRRDDAPGQLDFNIRCDRCLLRWGDQVPLFNLQNGPQLSEMRVQFDGVENSYATDQAIFLRCQPKGLSASEFTVARREEWSTERGTKFDIVVPHDLDNDSLPVDDWGAGELAVQDENSYLGIGCDPAKLLVPYSSPPAVFGKDSEEKSIAPTP